MRDDEREAQQGNDAPPEPETDEELDVEGPNESAPGHHPDPESERE